jgi:hypothetical protein
MKRENPFRCKIGNVEDVVSAGLPDALIETFANAEYALKKPLASVTVKTVSQRVG